MGMSEKMVKPVDDHVKARIGRIFKEKERHAYELKKKAEAAKIRRTADGDESTAEPVVESPCPPADTQVVQAASTGLHWCLSLLLHGRCVVADCIGRLCSCRIESDRCVPSPSH